MLKKLQKQIILLLGLLAIGFLVLVSFRFVPKADEVCAAPGHQVDIDVTDRDGNDARDGVVIIKNKISGAIWSTDINAIGEASLRIGDGEYELYAESGGFSSQIASLALTASSPDLLRAAGTQIKLTVNQPITWWKKIQFPRLEGETVKAQNSQCTGSIEFTVTAVNEAQNGLIPRGVNQAKVHGPMEKVEVTLTSGADKTPRKETSDKNGKVVFKDLPYSTSGIEYKALVSFVPKELPAEQILYIYTDYLENPEGLSARGYNGAFITLNDKHRFERGTIELINPNYSSIRVKAFDTSKTGNVTIEDLPVIIKSSNDAICPNLIESQRGTNDKTTYSKIIADNQPRCIYVIDTRASGSTPRFYVFTKFWSDTVGFDYISSSLSGTKSPVHTSELPGRKFDLKIDAKPSDATVGVSVVHKGKKVSSVPVYAWYLKNGETCDSTWNDHIRSTDDFMGYTSVPEEPLTFGVVKDTGKLCVMLGPKLSSISAIISPGFEVLGDPEGTYLIQSNNYGSNAPYVELDTTTSLIKSIVFTATTKQDSLPAPKPNRPAKPGVKRSGSGVVISGSNYTALNLAPKSFIPRALAAGTLQKFIIYREVYGTNSGFSKLAEVAKTGSNVSFSYTDTSLKSTTSGIFCYYVTAAGLDTAGQPAESEPSLTVCINTANNAVGSDPTKLTSAAVVKSPTSLATKVVGDGERIDVTWKNGTTAGGFDSTIIERSTTDDFATVIHTVISSDREIFGDTSLTLGQTYYYRAYSIKNLSDGTSVSSLLTQSVRVVNGLPESTRLKSPRIQSVKFGTNDMVVKIKSNLPARDQTEKLFEIWVKSYLASTFTKVGDVTRAKNVTVSVPYPCTASANTSCLGWPKGTYQVYVRSVGTDSRSAKSSTYQITK